jgi:Na+/melibiose symporter-like transporter
MCYSYQMVTEYTLGATTNDPDQLSKVAGLFKFYSSLGMFLSFILAGQGVVFLGQSTLQLVLYFLGSIAVVYILWQKILETNYFTEENVIVPHDIEEKMRLEGKVDEEVIRREQEKERLAAEKRARDDGVAGVVEEGVVAGDK